MMKDCKKIHPLLSLYIDGRLTPAELRQVDRHLKVCSDARRELETYQNLYQATRSLPEPQPPKDLHEKIMARVTGNRLPLPARRPLWVFPAWGLATAACLSVFLLIQNPDLLTFDREKTKTAPEEPQKASSTLTAPKPFSPVPANGGNPGQKEKSQAAFSGNVILDKTQPPPDNKDVAKNFAPSEEAPPAPAPQGMPLERAKKLSLKSNKVFQPMNKSLDLASAPPANAREQAIAPIPQAQEASPNRDASLPFALGATSAAAPAPALVPPTPNPTEGAFQAIPASRQITASTWTGDGAPATIESGVIVTDAVTFQQDWQELRPGESVPQVDFTAQVVVFLTAGEEPAAGYSIHVSSLEEKADQLVIHYKVEIPASGTVESQIISHPWSMQVIPKPSVPVIFQKDP
jgi:hypothetical protein